MAACPPDLGPLQVLPGAGVSAIGVVPWVINYNVPVQAQDFEFGEQHCGGSAAYDAIKLSDMLIADV